MPQITWNKCLGDVWCNLQTVNVAHAHFANMHGVYMIWHGGVQSKTVYVGKGNIAEGIVARRADVRVQPYMSFGIYVTWASVPADILDGVHAFLTQQFRPLVADEPMPPVLPVQVNLPA